MVKVRVHAVGLNFKDVLNVLMPEEAGFIGDVPLPGMEFAGEVVCVSEDNDPGNELCVGDRVFGLGSEAVGMLRTDALVTRTFLTKIPPRFSFEEVAHMPIVFLTVEYALGVQAKLKAGERILIPSAAGGVGLAAVQFAQRVGAEIFATASAAKHDYLRSLGIQHISTTRDEEIFHREMSEMVGSRGVDVVLNSLTSGEYVGKTVSLVAKGGRFVELGKRSIWSH
jgi:myxalamid-type polyketide synthase MxaB